MEIEIFETAIGLFKAVPFDRDENLLFVQTFLIHNGQGDWENVGYMKKKDFFKFIKDKNGKKKEIDQSTRDTFWDVYGVIKI